MSNVISWLTSGAGQLLLCATDCPGHSLRRYCVSLFCYTECGTGGGIGKGRAKRLKILTNFVYVSLIEENGSVYNNKIGPYKGISCAMWFINYRWALIGF